MDTFELVRSSLPVAEAVAATPDEYQWKVREMTRAFQALLTVFNSVEYEIRAGIPSEGPSQGFKTVEGTVFLDWGQDVPGSFKVRAYIESDADEIPIINGVRHAMERVFSFCVERAEQPHADYVRRLLASVIEIRTLLDQLQVGHHTELTFEPEVGGAKVSAMCWIDGEQHEDIASYQDDEALQAMRTDLLSFVGGRIGNMLDEENTKRTTQQPRAETSETTTSTDTPEPATAEPVVASA